MSFPDIFDLTLRQAVSKLEKNGLQVGTLEYRPDIATNKVLDFKVNGISKSTVIGRWSEPEESSLFKLFVFNDCCEINSVSREKDFCELITSSEKII